MRRLSGGGQKRGVRLGFERELVHVVGRWREHNQRKEHAREERHKHDKQVEEEGHTQHEQRCQDAQHALDDARTLLRRVAHGNGVARGVVRHTRARSGEWPTSQAAALALKRTDNKLSHKLTSPPLIVCTYASRIGRKGIARGSQVR